MRNKIILLFVLSLYACFIWAQQTAENIQGKVTEQTAEGKLLPLVGANVYWNGTTTGTVTNEKGEFELEKSLTGNQLIISYIGYKSDTIEVGNQDYFLVELKSSVDLHEINVVERKKATEISMLNTIKVENIGEKEIMKAACCNLSESFETNPSVDVSFTDAVTGTRQIQMLGLSGPYTQITRENMPDIRGLSAIYGLTYIPGTWIEGIQLNKGTGSVINGYESIAGQINVELRKPLTADKMYLNLYTNEGGRLEANANFTQNVGEKWSTAVLLHAKNNSIEWDKNDDGFMDMPTGNNFIGINRWEYLNDDGLCIQFGVNGTYVDKNGGQMSSISDDNGTDAWEMDMNSKKFDAWSKIGKVSSEIPWRSFGFQTSASYHEQDSKFGSKIYDAKQSSFYTNFIYQSILWNTNHKFKTGASFQYDKYEEDLNTMNYKRDESVPGTFFEYSYSHCTKFNLVAGFRADWHNQFGLFFTPRIHARYALTESTVLRASAGRGQRTASVFSENIGLLASSRELIIESDDSDKPYGLKPEVAWNFGFNFTQKFDFNHRQGTVSFDLYRTYFENQIVVDLEQSPQKAYFYNLDGESYSNSFQTQVDYELLPRLDVRIAYRWFDVKTTYKGDTKQKPLIAAHRAFMNLGYSTKNDWTFDYTINWQGEKRIPFTSSNPVEFQMKEKSPDFILMNAQVSKKWGHKFEIYVGVENLLGYKQKNPILSSEAPFSENFDSSLIWGPIFGRKVYAGLRYRIGRH